MKRELWPKIRVGGWVLFVDEYAGVFRAKVLETDLRVYSESEPGRWVYPYGLTLETGVVKIQYDSTERIENLADLVYYSAARLDQLRRSWDEWQEQKAAAEGLREDFLSLISELKEK